MHHKMSFRNRRVRQVLSLAVALLLIGAVSFLGVRYYESSNANSEGSIYASPASGQVDKGSTVSVTVRGNSGSTAVNSAQFFLTYDASQLQYSGKSEGGAYNFEGLTDSNQAGVVKIFRGMQDATLTGDNAIVTLNFKVLASSGNVAVGIDRSNSSLVSNGQDILKSVTGASYSVRQVAAAADATYSFSPSSGNVAKNDTLTVAVKLNSPTQKAFSAQPIISYPANQLQYVEAANSSEFPLAVRTKNTTGTLDVIRGVAQGTSGFSGEGAVVTVKFKVIGSAGEIPLSIKDGSGVYDGGGQNLLKSSSAAKFNIASQTNVPLPDVTPTNPTPPTGGVDNGGNDNNSGGDNSGGNSSDGQTGNNRPVYKETVTYLPRAGSSASVSDSGTQVQGSIDLSPLVNPEIVSANPGDTIAKVEYQLDGKSVASKTESPFTYTFDTRKLQNGKYEIKILTTYASGTVDETVDTLIVRNPITLSYVMSHYGITLLVSFICLIVAALVIWKYIRPRFLRHDAAAAQGGYQGYISGAGLGASNQVDPHAAPDPAVIAPSGGYSTDAQTTPEQRAATESTDELVIDNPETIQSSQPVQSQQPGSQPSSMQDIIRPGQTYSPQQPPVQEQPVAPQAPQQPTQPSGPAPSQDGQQNQPEQLQF